MRGVRGRALLTVAFGALAMVVVAGVAAAAKVDKKPAKVRVGDVELIGNGAFSPSALPRNELAPVGLAISGSVRSLSGAHPPPLAQLLLKTDENGTVEAKGYPNCNSDGLVSQDPSKPGCKEGILGRGTMQVEIEFPESPPVAVSSDLLVLNGGVGGGVTTLYVHAYITIPVPAAIVTTVKIRRVNKGRYGWLWTASIPKIAGGSGSITDFSLEIDKRFTYKGKRVSLLNLMCPDGRARMHATAVFADSQRTRASLGLTRPCTPTG